LVYEALINADLLIPDGIGVVHAARILHGVRLARIPGVELMQDICQLAATEGHRVFVYGGREEVNMTATEILRRRYPGLEIAGRSNGYVKEEHMPDLIDQINKSKAEILFLALGSPKQEIWFARNRHSLENVKICQGIGGSLDTIAGNVKRAPAIWRKCSAEWLYRLIKEPKRIKRQRVLPLFVLMVLSRKVSSGFRSSNKGTPR
jgi:N-acetylglucosaminyldiphosphoundecaprenol N-acetyl-beta-D-mannosaminyltransferase